MPVVRWLIIVVVAGALVLGSASRPAGAAPRPSSSLHPVAVASANDVAVSRQDLTGSSTRAADYLFITAGVGAWATVTIWLATRHRRRLWAAFARAAAGLGDEAEKWLRDQ